MNVQMQKSKKTKQNCGQGGVEGERELQSKTTCVCGFSLNLQTLHIEHHTVVEMIDMFKCNCKLISPLYFSKLNKSRD